MSALKRESPHLKTDWPVVIFACVSLLVFGLLDNVRGPFFSQVLQDMSVADGWGSLFFAVASGFAFAGSLNGGRVLWRLEAVGALRLGLLLMGIGFVGLGFVPNFIWLLMSCAVFGGGLGITGFAQNVAVSEGAAPHQRRQLLSMLHAMYGLSSLLAPIGAGLLMRLGWGWRHSFVLLGSLPLLLWGASFKMTKPSLSRSRTESQGPPTAAPAELAHFIFLALAVAFYLLGEISVATRMVLFLEREHGLTAEAATQYLTVFFLLLFLMRVVFGVARFSRLSNRQIMYTSATFGAAGFAAGLIWSPWWLAASGLAMGPFYPLAIEEVRTIFKARASAALAYVLGVGSFLVVLMHLGIGVLTDRFGIRQALWVGPIGMLLVVLLLKLEERIFRRFKSKANE